MTSPQRSLHEAALYPAQPLPALSIAHCLIRPSSAVPPDKSGVLAAMLNDIKCQTATSWLCGDLYVKHPLKTTGTV